MTNTNTNTNTNNIEVNGKTDGNTTIVNDTWSVTILEECGNTRIEFSYKHTDFWNLVGVLICGKVTSLMIYNLRRGHEILLGFLFNANQIKIDRVKKMEFVRY